MAYDLSALDRVQQRFVRRGTSLFIETYNQDTEAILDSFEFTNAPQSIPGEVLAIAQRRILDLVSPVDGALSANSQAALGFVVSDSILAQSFDPPNSTFGCTTAAGSYFNGSNVKTTGVTNVYTVNPCRLKFRAAHNLVTGDEVFLDELPSNHPLASRRYTVTVTAADEVTLNGVDGTVVPEFTSAGASSDAMAYIDMGYANYGALSWMLHEMGYPFASIDGVCRPGATSTQLASAVAQWPAGAYTHGILHVGRNDLAYDPAALGILRDAMLARCKWVVVCIPHPDSTWGGYTAGSLAKLKSIAAFWYAAQKANPLIKVCDFFGVISDPTAALEAALAGTLSSDNVHPQANGAKLLGEKLAADFPPISVPRRALARLGSGSANLLTNGRFTALTGGTVGSGVTGSVAAGWTIGGRSSAKVTGGYVQCCVTPALQRRSGIAYAAGDILDAGDGWWYIVKTAGTSAASLPAGYASAVLHDTTTGVTDGTAVVFRVPKWATSRDRVIWQYQNLQLSGAIEGDTENLSFYQSIALPGSVAVGAYVQAQVDVVVLGGYTKGITMRLSEINGSAAQIARAHSLGVNTPLSTSLATEMRPRTLQTPKIRVRSGTATLEARCTAYIGLDGLQFCTALGMLEETTAPGLLA